MKTYKVTITMEVTSHVDASDSEEAVELAREQLLGLEHGSNIVAEEVYLWSDDEGGGDAEGDDD